MNKINIFRGCEREMEWEAYWNALLEKKKMRPKVEEMDQADEILGNDTRIEEICHQIYIDYIDWRKKLENIKRDFLKIIDSLQGVHLQCSRIKSLDSLLIKVITKRHKNLKNDKSGYARISGENYKSIITDLIGLRLIINYRGKWTDIHEEIISAFPYGNKEEYSKGKLLRHVEGQSGRQVEMPKVYYAEGDNIEEYEKYGLDVKLHDKGYRSIHYTISYQGVYIEIQVRTIYDEAWSDCDHNYVYKQENNISHTALEQISSILCKLTNISNDMGENMKEIFDEESFVEIEGNKWRTSLKNVQLFDQVLDRIKETQNDLESFRKRLIVNGH